MKYSLRPILNPPDYHFYRLHGDSAPYTGPTYREGAPQIQAGYARSNTPAQYTNNHIRETDRESGNGDVNSIQDFNDDDASGQSASESATQNLSYSNTPANLFYRYEFEDPIFQQMELDHIENTINLFLIQGSPARMFPKQVDLNPVQSTNPIIQSASERVFQRPPANRLSEETNSDPSGEALVNPNRVQAPKGHRLDAPANLLPEQTDVNTIVGSVSQVFYPTSYDLYGQDHILGQSSGEPTPPQLLADTNCTQGVPAQFPIYTSSAERAPDRFSTYSKYPRGFRTQLPHAASVSRLPAASQSVQNSPKDTRKASTSVNDNGEVKSKKWTRSELDCMNRCWTKLIKKGHQGEEGLLLSVASKYMGSRNYIRTAKAIKNQWNRIGRTEANVEDRRDRKDGQVRKLVTSARANKALLGVARTAEQVRANQNVEETDESDAELEGLVKDFQATKRAAMSRKRNREDDNEGGSEPAPKRPRQNKEIDVSQDKLA